MHLPPPPDPFVAFFTRQPANPTPDRPHEDGVPVQARLPGQAGAVPCAHPGQAWGGLHQHLPPTHADGEQQRLAWVLDDALPRHWQTYPWQDEPGFRHRALLLRQARWRAQPFAGLQHCWWINQFPTEEHDFLQAMQDLIDDACLRRWRQHITPPPAGGELFVLAHGRAHGLIDRQGRQLRLSAPLPATVWLLACNVKGALNRLADELLHGHGVRTVIVASGDISAPEMEALLRHRLQLPQLSPEQLLRELPPHLLQHSAPLEIWGEVALDHEPHTQHWNHLTWQQWQNDATRPRPPEVLDATLRQALDSPHCWTFTRRWLLPAALSLAEQQDHPYMQRLTRRIGNEWRVDPALARETANAMRRQGLYGAASDCIAIGMSTATDDDERYQLVTMALLLGLDLALPAEAAPLLDTARRLLDRTSDAVDRLMERHKMRDWQARLNMRQGKVPAALALLHDKWRAARQQDEDGLREVATLLHFGAWGQAAGVHLQPTDLDELAGQATHALLSLRRMEQRSPGNDTRNYLARALASHHWATATQPAPWLLEELNESLATASDPGPAGQAILLLADQAPATAALAELALQKLEQEAYFLEAAMLAIVHGRTADAARLWHSATDQRQRVREGLHPLLPAMRCPQAAPLHHSGDEPMPASVTEIVARGLTPL